MKKIKSLGVRGYEKLRKYHTLPVRVTICRGVHSL